MATIRGTNFDDDIDGTYYADTIYGFAGDDRMWGYEGDDLLFGGAGNDELDGGTGWDEMRGGLGSDLYVVDNVNDEVIEFANEGDFDVVYTDLRSYRLNADVEDLIAFGATDFYGIGNALNNQIHGFVGDDTLDGGAGIDTLFGEKGNDTYYLDDQGDRAVELAGEGYDYVFTSRNALQLEANLEELLFDGIGSFTGNGNALDNFIRGGAANDRLSGGDGDDELNGAGGADALNGGRGDDVYIVDSLGDRAFEGPAANGFDRVESSVTFALGARIEDLKLTGNAQINGYGNELVNFIDGNAAANVLRGNAGNDDLFGAGGADSLFGGIGNDVLEGGGGRDSFAFDTALNASTNVDTIVDFDLGADRIFLDRGVFGTIPNGTLNADAFVEGASARDAQDRIVYDQDTGRIFYDRDGAGGTAAILFARVDAGTALANVDFTIYG